MDTSIREYAQLSMPFFDSLPERWDDSNSSYEEKLKALLQSDLDFQGESGQYASHNFHAFPAKFPPQLPALFIEHLTSPDETILDPMVGSGTTLVEAVLRGRNAIGVDIDPLALLIAKVKTTPLDPVLVGKTGFAIIESSQRFIHESPDALWHIKEQWTPRTREFVDYWFAPETQIELLALSTSIQQVLDNDLRAFFMLIFSSTIITKSGGVSLARDLAHTRPHRAKVIFSVTGEIIEGAEFVEKENPRLQHISKVLTSPLVEFEKRLQKAVNGMKQLKRNQKAKAFLSRSDAQRLPLRDNVVDLIVTSPPYASNAIDYMRAHKFSLVWFGYLVESLSQTRKKYIGSENTQGLKFEDLPERPSRIIEHISVVDQRKGLVLRRYFSETKRMLKEMHRVLKPGKAAIVVVGSSIIRGIDTETGHCLAEIGQSIGFQLVHVGIRNLDRDRRMMPAGHQIDPTSQIQRRMHQEFVIGFTK